MSRAYFSDWLTDNSYTLPTVSKLDTSEQEVLDTATRANIEAWFQLRQIVPHFDVFFQRALNTAYPYYVELLRVDPSVSSFDWLVDNYVERQTASTDDTTRTPDLTTERTPDLTSATEYNSQTQESGAPQTVTTHDVTETTTPNTTKTRTGGETYVKSGNRVLQKTGTDTDTRTGSVVTTPAGTTTTTEDGDVFREVSGLAGNNTVTRTMGFGRQNPMNAEYSGFSTSISSSKTIESESMPADGIQTPSSHSVTVDFNTSNFNDPKIENPTSSSDALASSGAASESNEFEHTRYEGRTSSVSYTNRSDTTSYNDVADTKKYGSSETETYGNITDQRTYDSVTDKETGTVTKKTEGDVTTAQTLDKTDTKTGTDTVKTTGSETTKATGTETTSNQHILRDIATGRNQNVADLLQRAKVYIRNSRAWDYLKAQLDPCFYQVYDLDDLVYSEED